MMTMMMKKKKERVNKDIVVFFSGSHGMLCLRGNQEKHGKQSGGESRRRQMINMHDLLEY